MPTRYWLVGRADVSRRQPPRGGRRGAAGRGRGRRRRARRRPRPLRRRARRRGASRRDAGGPVRGRRRRHPEGVKCLHAHYAWYLAGGDDPVGRWVAERSSSADDAATARRIEPTTDDDRVDAVDDDVRPRCGARSTVPIGPRSLLPASSRDPTRRAPTTHQRPRRGDRPPRRRRPRAPGRWPTPTGVHRRRRRGVAPRCVSSSVARSTDADRGARAATPPRTCSARSPPSARGRRACTTRPRPRAGRHDRRHAAAACVAVMRRLHLDEVAVSTGRERPDAPTRRLDHHPSVADASPLRLYGKRVMLRPLVPPDFAGVERGPAAQRALAHAVGAVAARQPGRPDASTATRSPPAARRATAIRQLGVAYAFGLFVDNALRRRGQPQQRPPRRAAVGHGRLLDRPGPRRPRLHRRRRRRADPVRVRGAATCTAWRSASSRATTTAAG